MAEEKFSFLIETAKKEIKTSDHLMNVTFSTKDLKFLMSIVDHMVKATQSALDALLEYERYYKNIGPVPNDFTVEIDAFKEKLLVKHKFQITDLNLLRRLDTISKSNKDAIIRFKKDDKYVFSSHQFNTDSVDEVEIKKLIRFSKEFISKVDEIVKNEKDRASGSKDTVRRVLTWN